MKPLTKSMKNELRMVVEHAGGCDFGGDAYRYYAYNTNSLKALVARGLIQPTDEWSVGWGASLHITDNGREAAREASHDEG